VQVLDRILERQNVPLQGPIDMTHQRRDGAGLARSAHAGHEDEPTLGLCQRRKHRRKLQRRDGGNIERDHAHHDHEGRPLAQHVHTEPADSRHAPGAIIIPDLVDPRLVFEIRHQPQRDRPRLLGRETLFGEWHQLSVNPRSKDVTGLDVQIRCATIHCRFDDLFHGSSIPPQDPRG
jgi:hypothetical protein